MEAGEVEGRVRAWLGDEVERFALPYGAERWRRREIVAAGDGGRTPCPDEINKPLPLHGV